MATVDAQYAELQKQFEEEGLFEPRPWFYVRQSVIVLALLAGSVLFLQSYTGFWGQMVNAMFLAVPFVLAGYLMHDTVHNQILVSGWVFPVFNFLFGWSCTWWEHKHNLLHHCAPNHESDPDFQVKYFAFNPAQAHQKQGVYRLTTQYQHLLFFPLLCGELLNLRLSAMSWLWAEGTALAKRDLLIFVGHHVACLAFLSLFLPWWQVPLFALVHTGTVGFCLGMAFSVNHIGMSSGGGQQSKFLEQIVTARNVSGGWFVSFIFGGLNFQIEHHIFPNMPRPSLTRVAPVIEAFCLKNGIPYHSVSLRRAYVELWRHLKNTAQYARENEVTAVA